MVFRLSMILLLLTAALFAGVDLINGKAQYDDFTIGYLYDETAVLTADEIAEHSFTTVSNQFTFGYRDGAIWFKVAFENHAKQEDFVLNFNEAIWKHFDLYVYEEGRWSREANGLEIPLSQRTVKDVTPSFRFHIDHNSSKTLYIRGETIASQIGMFRVFTEEAYFNPTRLSISHYYIVFAFILMSIVLLNLYSFILTRENVYLYYIGYMVALILFSAMHSGWYLMFGLNGWSEGLHVIGTFVILFLLLFSDQFLELKSKLPRIHRFFRFSIAVFLLFAVLIYHNIPYTSLLFNLYSSLFFLILFIASIKIFMKGSVIAKYYLLALIIYAPLMALMILTFNALLDYSCVNRHIFLLGALVEVIFFTLILTGKYHAVNLEKIRIQGELLVEKQKNEAVLETEIDRRTQALQEANEHLSSKTKELMRTQKELEKLAVTDCLTRLYNRHKMDEVLETEHKRAMESDAPLGVMIIDVDDFKQINDTCGHRVGDSVLIEFADLLEASTHDLGISARWGGEEFIVVCPKTDLQESMALAETIRRNIESHQFEEIGRVTASFGVTAYRRGETVDQMIDKADRALYTAKKGGKNRVIASAG